MTSSGCEWISRAYASQRHSLTKYKIHPCQNLGISHMPTRPVTVSKAVHTVRVYAVCTEDATLDHDSLPDLRHGAQRP